MRRNEDGSIISYAPGGKNPTKFKKIKNTMNNYKKQFIQNL